MSLFIKCANLYTLLAIAYSITHQEQREQQTEE